MSETAPSVKKTPVVNFGISGITLILAIIIAFSSGAGVVYLKYGSANTEVAQETETEKVQESETTPGLSTTATEDEELLPLGLQERGELINLLERLQAYVGTFTNTPAVLENVPVVEPAPVVTEPALPEPLATVIGRVVDGEGHPVTGAIVRLAGKEMEVGSQGYFSIPLFQDNTALEVTAPDYYVWRTQVNASQPNVTVVLRTGEPLPQESELTEERAQPAPPPIVHQKPAEEEPEQSQ